MTVDLDYLASKEVESVTSHTPSPEWIRAEARRRRRRRHTAMWVPATVALVMGGLVAWSNLRTDGVADVVVGNEADPGEESLADEIAEGSDVTDADTRRADPSVGEPEETGTSAPSVLWERSDVRPEGGTFPSGGLLLLDSEQIYVADGFEGSDVVAVSGSSGEEIWSRSPLGDSATSFLQLAVDGLVVVSEQHGPVVALDPDDGTPLWRLELPDRYGANGIAMIDTTLVVSADTTYEGDTRPPVIIAVHATSGEELWRTSLADGTDLQWRVPSVASDIIVVQSTLSHPDSAQGNIAHALDPATGDVRWEVQLGGSQGFHTFPAVIGESEIYLSANYEHMVVVDRASGDVRWQLPDVRPLLLTSADSLLVATQDQISLLDPTAQTLSDDMTIEIMRGEAILHATHLDSRILITTTTRILVVDIHSLEVLSEWQAPPPRQIVDSRIMAGRGVAILTTNGTVTVLEFDA